MNSIVLHGRLAQDVKEKDYTNRDGQTNKMAMFCVAVDRRWGEGTNYFDCSAFGKTADIIATHFHKGQEIVVRGEMNMRDVEKDGNKRRYWSVNVDQFDFCGKKADNEGKMSTEPSQPTETPDSFEAVDEDTPF